MPASIASDASYRTIFAYAEAPLLIVRPADGVIVEANPCAAKLFGCALEGLVGRSVLEFSLDADALKKRLADVVRYGRISYEAPALRQDGRRIELEVRATLINMHGLPRILAAPVDVSEREAAKRRAEEAARRFRAVIEHSSDHIGMITPEGIGLYVSPSTFTLLGYRPEELVDTNVLNLLHPDDRPVATTAIRKCIAAPGHSPEIELRVRHADGQWRRMECVVTNLLDEPAVGAILVNSRDVTQRHLLHEELRASEERYRSIVETASQGLWIIDSETRTTFVNAPMAEMLGYSVAEMIGKTPLDFSGGPWRDEAQRQIDQRRRGIRDVFDVELLHRDGHAVHVLMCAAPLYSDSGQYEGSLAMVVDVTDRTQLEQRLRHDGTMKAVGHLAGGIAHQFNNLLTVILASSHSVRKALPSGHAGIRGLDSVIRSGMRAAALTSQLLAFGRKQILYPEVFDLNTLIQDIADTIWQTVGEGIHVSVRLSGSPAAIRADKAQVEQILIELASNARDAMPHGGNLTVGVAVEATQAILQISDTGRGIDKTTQDRIFEPFFTTAPAGERTGLGLSIVHEVIRQSGGAIAVQSQPNAGTTFSVSFPLCVEMVPKPPVRQIPNQQKLTVLVVEDESEVRTLVEEILAGSSFDVLSAPSASAAVALADQHSPIDILLSDVVMPGGSGPWAAEQVRLRHPGVRVLYMSGYTDNELLRHGVRTGETPLLLKPFTPSALVQFLCRS